MSASGRNDAGRALREVGATMTTDLGKNSSPRTTTAKRSPCCSWPILLDSRKRWTSPGARSASISSATASTSSRPAPSASRAGTSEPPPLPAPGCDVGGDLPRILGRLDGRRQQRHNDWYSPPQPPVAPRPRKRAVVRVGGRPARSRGRARRRHTRGPCRAARRPRSARGPPCRGRTREGRGLACGPGHGPGAG